MSNFMKILPVGDDLFYADGQTDRYGETKSFFKIFANAPNSDVRTYCEPTVICSDIGNAVAVLRQQQQQQQDYGCFVSGGAKTSEICRGMARSVTALGKFTNGLKNQSRSKRRC